MAFAIPPIQGISSSPGPINPGMTASGLNGACALGGIVFAGLQSPDVLTFGGKHQSAPHMLGGGGKVLDMLGPEEDDIVLAVRLWGPNAINVALQLNAMRMAGWVGPLAWANGLLTVFFKHFSCDYQQRGHMLPCRITLEIIPTNAGADVTIPPSQSTMAGLAAAHAFNALNPSPTDLDDQADGSVSDAETSLQEDDTTGAAGHASDAAASSGQAATNAGQSVAQTAVMNPSVTEDSDAYANQVAQQAGQQATSGAAAGAAGKAAVDAAPAPFVKVPTAPPIGITPAD